MPALPLIGFPQLIEVTLGSAWQGDFPAANPLSPDDVLVLTRVGSDDKWSEDGTNVPNDSTNRLILLPAGFAIGGSKHATMSISVGGQVAGHVTLSGTNLLAGYAFLAIWSASTLYGTWYTSAGFTGSPHYNPDLFSLVREAVAADISGGQANRLLLGVG